MTSKKREMENNPSIKERMTVPRALGKTLYVVGAGRRQLTIVGVMAVLVLLMLGCAPAEVDPPPAEEPAQEVNVTLGPGFVFNPDMITVDPGRPVDLVVENLNDIDHTFTIDELDIDLRVAPGQQQEITFTPAETGTFEFYCTEPGHRDQGMVGWLGVGEEPEPQNGPGVTDEEDDDDETPGY